MKQYKPGFIVILSVILFLGFPIFAFDGTHSEALRHENGENYSESEPKKAVKLKVSESKSEPTFKEPIESDKKSARKPATEANKFGKRYVFFRGKMDRGTDVKRLLNLMKRASAAGYNGIVIGDRGRWRNMKKQPQSYFRDYARIKDEARRLGLPMIPVAFDQWGPSRENIHLGEAFPVKGTKFVVKGASASVQTDPKVELQNPGFENYMGHQPIDWGVDQPGKITFVDLREKRSGKASVKIKDPGVGDPKHGHARVRQKMSVSPFRAYGLSVWIRTKNFDNIDDIRIYVSGERGDERLYSRVRYDRGSIASTQDWKEYIVDFNSLNNEKITVWLGAWSRGLRTRGEVWFDDVAIEEVGLKQTVRRASTPVTVTSSDGKKTYREGKDYVVERQKLIIPSDSEISDGQALKVNWYQLADVVYDPPEASACNQEFFDFNTSTAKGIDNLLSPPGFMMNYDEWRVANWDPACGGIGAGEYVAKTIRKSEEALKTVNPSYELYIWNDMVDPYHNARSNYYVVNGSLIGSWEGVSPSTVIMNWRLKEGDKSLKFFADRGHRQIIAGYYSGLGNVSQWLDAVDRVEAEGARGIIGFMYTTWGKGNYDDLEEVAELIKKRGRWGSGPAFPKNDAG